ITLGGRERVPMAMRKRLFQLFTVVGAITTGIFALVIFASIIKCASSEDGPDTTVLELRLDRPLAPGPADPLSSLLGEKGPGLIDVIAALERAGDDDRIAGVLVHLADVDYGFANVQEIRDGIARLREKGKWVVAHA